MSFAPIPSKWIKCQKVMARDVVTRRLRRAWIITPRPYQHRDGTVRDGADIGWADLVRDPEQERIYGTPSSGGWTFEIVDGWDDALAALDALGFALRCVGQWMVERGRREPLSSSTQGAA